MKNVRVIMEWRPYPNEKPTKSGEYLTCWLNNYSGGMELQMVRYSEKHAMFYACDADVTPDSAAIEFDNDIIAWAKVISPEKVLSDENAYAEIMKMDIDVGTKTKIARTLIFAE